MERFCDKCGTLVSGEGAFCPQCGAPMTSAVNLNKQPDNSSMDVIMPGSVKLGAGETPQTEDYFSGSSASPMNSVPQPSMGDMGTAQDVVKAAEEAAAKAAAQNTYSAPIPTPAPSYNQPGNYGQMPNYPQSANVTSSSSVDMTIGQWVGTLLLGSCLGIISLILLFVWAFGDTPQPKKNFAKAYLIIQAVAVGLYILLLIGIFACTGSIAGSDIWDEMMY